MAFDIDILIGACQDDAADAGITIRTVLEPLAGPYTPVKPPIYQGPKYQEDRRWWGDPPVETRVIVLDNTPSQANRLEAALQAARAELGLPEIELDLSGIVGLPPHLPRRLSSFQFPHRQADAYLRDATLGDQPFARTAQGRAIVDATAENPEPLFRWFPQALLFGYWQSHLGKKRTQAKLARSWTSEIVGIAPALPADDRTRVLGLKGDPLNLSSEEPVDYDEDDIASGWQLSRLEGRAKRKRLSKVGHGQVPLGGESSDGEVRETLAGVSFRAIEQHATVSFASLRRIWCQDPANNAIGRALLVALGLVAHVSAFGRSFSLRSGCDLRPAHTTWLWRGERSDEQIQEPSVEQTIALFRECRARAHSVGLIVGGGWDAEPLVVGPNAELNKAIAGTWPLGV